MKRFWISLKHACINVTACRETWGGAECENRRGMGSSGGGGDLQLERDSPGGGLKERWVTGEEAQGDGRGV